MGIRIKRIKVNRGGPLSGDFVLEPADLNLVFGPNESGKTYIVEALVSMLFKTGARSPANWHTREWNIGGSVSLTGLEEGPLSFTKTGKKLEDYWKDGTGLPLDFSRLLVVKAGETELAEEPDGVGRTVVKDYLSGEGLLDTIANRISGTLKNARVENRQIIGAHQSELKTRSAAGQDLKRIDQLLSDIEGSHALGEIANLNRKREAIDSELRELARAKRCCAGGLHNEALNLKHELDALPGEEALSKLESESRVYERNVAQLNGKTAELARASEAESAYQWTKRALEQYEEILVRRASPWKRAWWPLLAVMSLIGATVTGLLGLKLPLLALSASTLVFAGLYFFHTKRTASNPAMHIELESLRREFSSRFGQEITSKASLQAQLDQQGDVPGRARTLQDDVTRLTQDIEIEVPSILDRLTRFTGEALPIAGWEDAIASLRSSIQGVEDRITSKKEELAALGVPKEEYEFSALVDAEWDRGRFKALNVEFESILNALTESEENLNKLKTRVAHETGSDSTSWEELIGQLRVHREEQAREYRRITAEILAKAAVLGVIGEFREEENERIAEGLKREELVNPLRAVTGRYGSIRLGDSGGLSLVSDEDEEFALEELSTGAREQIHLALRTGFASVAMEGQSAFLILDDAFQHSDWERRKRLVSHAVDLVEAGWQILYFSMDNHIKELFEQTRARLGDRLGIKELA